MTCIHPSDTEPGRYAIEGEDFALTCGELVEVRASRCAWWPARIEHDGADYVALFTDQAGGCARLCDGLAVRRPRRASDDTPSRVILVGLALFVALAGDPGPVRAADRTAADTPGQPATACRYRLKSISPWGMSWRWECRGGAR
jgi:hypothetical protein